MEKFKFVFIILAFRTGNDIPSFLQSLSEKLKEPYKVIVVNSFYSDESLNEIRNVARVCNCDFIPIENKGYGYGNNRGIDFALAHYKFDFLVVCNADIELKSFKYGDLHVDKLNAPMITTITGKKQNPYFAIRNPLSAWLIYHGHKKKSKVLLLAGRGINKIIRETFLFIFNHSDKREAMIYAAHGSFLIFPCGLLKVLQPVFDENMFLFCEEDCLANKLYKMESGIVLHKDIAILHYEDGSTKGSNIDTSSFGSKSYIYFYEQYIKKMS